MSDTASTSHRPSRRPPVPPTTVDRCRRTRGTPRVVAALAGLLLPTLAVAQLQNIDYEGTDEAFPNPERGWYFVRQPGERSKTLPLDDLDDAFFDDLRTRHITMVRQVYVLGVSTDDGEPWMIPDTLSPPVLDTLEADLARVRAAGFKLIPKFAYHWVHDVTGDEDASAAIIADHLEELRPILADNEDVIAFMEEGFVGYWGEWHDSVAGHVDPGTLDLSASGRRVFGQVADLLPTRPWAARYAEQVMQVFPEPLTPDAAYGGSRQSRVGLFNAGFRSTPSDFGSWSSFDPVRESDQKAYAVVQTRYTVQSGEPAGVPDETQREYALSASGLLADLETFGYDALAVNQTDAVRDGQYAAWQREGAFDEADRRLGYRYRLVSSELPTDLGAGAPFGVSVVVANDGWSGIYNPRAIEIVLRPVSGGVDVRLPVVTPRDVRALLPEPGTERRLFLPTTLPAEIVADDYEVFLNLPDSAPRLRERPEYGIRFANAGSWEPATGFNRLNAVVRIWP